MMSTYPLLLTDPLLEILMIPTFPQMQPQPQTIDSTSNETTLDSPNQEHMATEIDEFKPHPMPTVELAEPIPHPMPDNWSQMSRNAKKTLVSTSQTIIIQMEYN